MIRYILETSTLNDILHLLFKLFNLRITFFDLNDSELDRFDIKPMNNFCQTMRQDAEFLKECKKCDREHLEIAKDRKESILYICHAGLYEGIVPLYHKNDYLGSLVFGQVRPAEQDIPQNKYKKVNTLISDLPIISKPYLTELSQLLKLISEYIIIKEVVQHTKKPWVEQLHTYIHDHLKQKITVDDLAGHINKSRSFISHYFKNEFDTSAMKYIQNQKLKSAYQKLLNGASIKETANEYAFYDEYHFSKAFKTCFGINPSKVNKIPVSTG